jgi:hypothetical protein
VPRFGRERVVFSDVTESEMLAIGLASQFMHFVSGYDSDGVTPLAVLIDTTTNRLLIYRGTLDASISGTIYPSFDLGNAAGGYAHQPVTGCIAHGCIVLLCRKVGGGTQHGVSIVYSTDTGVTWNLHDVPTRTTGTFASPFCLQNYWVTQQNHGGHPTEFWIAATDYHQQTGANGGQTALMRFSRPTGASPAWETAGLRVVFQEDGNGGEHFHCAGVAEKDGKLFIVTSRGDSTDDNAIILSTLDISGGRDDYLTEAITDNVNFHGGKVGDAGIPAGGKAGFQFTSIAPLRGNPNNGFLIGADYNPEVIAKLVIPDGDPATATNPQSIWPMPLLEAR